MLRQFLALCTLLVSLATAAQRIGPLIDAPWHQREPFNLHCPLWDGRESVEVGCVATSLTQIMTYYRYPECTRDTLFGWQTDHLTVDTILPGATIDWDNILADYRYGYNDEQASAIANLSLYAAMAAHMNFGTHSSGASTLRYVDELPRVFGYASCIACDRAYYTQDAWRQLLIGELEQGRPILYSAYNMSFAGHAFVVDGYDYQTGRFHANWGYGGDFDRWVDIDVMGQFEDPDDATFWGQRQALYCNHYALLIHPTERITPAADSITWHDGDVTIERLEHASSTNDDYRTGGYELIDIHLTNHRADTIAYTFEILSNDAAQTPIDNNTQLFEDADYVALGCVILQPGCSTIFRTPARFTATGQRTLRLSNDDITLQCPTPITVSEGQALTLNFSGVTPIAITDSSATLSVTIDKQQGHNGTLITYCLFAEDSNEDARHWQMLTDNDFADSASITDTVTFKHLAPSTTYTLMVRWPWDVRAEYTFTTADNTEPEPDTDYIYLQRPTTSPTRYYDLSGRRATHTPLLIDERRLRFHLW